MNNEEARRKSNPAAIHPLAPIQETQATKDQLAISFDAFAQIAKALQAAGAQGIGVPCSSCAAGRPGGRLHWRRARSGCPARWIKGPADNGPVAFGFPSRRAIPMSRRLRALAR